MKEPIHGDQRRRDSGGGASGDAQRPTRRATPPASSSSSADAPIFGPDSPLDSLGLVGLLLDVEEGLQAIGCDVVLSDERAVSQKRSPFRNVPSLVAYVSTLSRE